jgi:hypothetical protein
MNRELSQGNYSVAIFYKQKHLFTEMKDRKAKTVGMTGGSATTWIPCSFWSHRVGAGGMRALRFPR